MTSPRSHRFATTRWSIVQAAAHKSASTARVALEELCQTYWTPVYAFVRRQGNTQADAEDLTQAFFLHLLDSGFAHAADQGRGRFRSFLLKSVSNFMRADHRERNAQKRGGDVQTLSLDFESGEREYQSQAADTATAEQLFERRWALTLLQNTVRQLRDEYAERNHVKLFEHLEAHVNTDASRLPYAQLCEKLDMSDVAIKQAARRLKLRYREILRTEIANTVGSSDDIDDELTQLLSALSM